jgi:hypothetical protein
MSSSTTTKTMDEFQKEFRGKLYGAIAASILAGIVTAGLALWAYVKTLPGSAGLVPKNAVMAFSEPCPSDGWERYWPATSRMIVGAASESEMKSIPDEFSRVEGDKKMTFRPLLTTGGEEVHSMLPDQMPAHSHSYSFAYTALHVNSGTPQTYIKYGEDAGLVFKPANTEPAGSGTAFNVMSPYLALYFCKKN